MKRFLSGLAALLLSAAAFAQPAATLVEMKTSLGTLQLEVYPDRAPKTVENFLTYVKDGFYNGTIFHRVIPNFMIQGGGFTPDMKQKPTRAPVAHEGKAALDKGLRNNTGFIAMARTNDPNSATAQFFINVVNNPNLDPPSFDNWGYTVFGRVTQGMDVVEKIRGVATTTVPPHQNVPSTPVLIESMRIIEAKK
jgi:cyclophilin family peptidyl-prolyl cis-trans isomerase